METAVLALRVLASLGLVLALLWSLQKHLARKMGGAEQDAITVVARRGISQKASVVMLDAEGTRFVLAVTDQSVTVLKSSARPEPTPVTVEDDGFAESLQAARLATVSAPAAPWARAWSAVGDARRPGGTIFSPVTWRHAAAAVRQGPRR